MLLLNKASLETGELKWLSGEKRDDGAVWYEAMKTGHAK